MKINKSDLQKALEKGQAQSHQKEGSLFPKN